MDISDLPLQSMSDDELADRLFDAGRSLNGKNLKRSTWREIATFVVRSGGLATAMWQRLEKAKTREDVLRVLRIIRKKNERKASPKGGGARSTNAIAADGLWKTDWQDYTETDECWDFSRPLTAYEEYCEEMDRQRCELVLYEADGLMLTAEQATKTLQHRMPLLVDLQASSPQESTEARPVDLASDPLELRVSSHLKMALERYGNPKLEQAISQVIRSPQDLNRLHMAVTQRKLRGLVCFFSPFWIRSFSDWDGRSDLLNHLFVQNEVPECLYSEWYSEYPSTKWLCWFILLAQGGSLRGAAKHFAWQIPSRFQHHLTHAPSDCAPVELAMYAEIARMGGSETDFQRLRYPAFTSDPTESSGQADWMRFWRETVRWFVTNHDAIADDLAPQILDWAVHEHTEAIRQQPIGFSWKGRSVNATVRRSREYRRLRSQNRKYANYRWAGHSWDIEFEQKESAIGKNTSVVWAFMELTSGKELFEEGQSQNHCVASYATRCVAGHSAIFSMKRDGKRCLTIEICPKRRVLVQARGRFNRDRTPQEEIVINKWLTETVRAVGVEIHHRTGE